MSINSRGEARPEAAGPLSRWHAGQQLGLRPSVRHWFCDKRSPVLAPRRRVVGSFVVTVNLTTAARFTVFPVEGVHGWHCTQ